jgi:hypothetical protein
MSSERGRWSRVAGALFGCATIFGTTAAGRESGGDGHVLNPRDMPAIGTVDKRFQSYNVEMVEVTGGRFWKPYGAKDDPSASGASPQGMDPALFQYRPPIDLSNARLRHLAAALGPAYVRVSGTWANTVYFQDSDAPAPAKPPHGFGATLTRAEWKGVVDFSRAVGARIITSFATGVGNRDAAGNWLPDQAKAFITYNDRVGGDIAAAEFMNEPTYAAMGGAPDGYDAAAFGRDLNTFLPFLRDAAPGTLFLGPGSVGEGGALATAPAGAMLSSESLLKASGPVFDIFSYHLYTAASQRCASMGPKSQTTAAQALSPNLLSRIEAIDAFYADLANRYLPGKPRWITETADAACGGNPWASTFLDTFRYLQEHARLAQLGVRVIAHNTLASSDYGLLDEDTYEPRPDYWAALLWSRLMGVKVLDPGTSRDSSVRVYAHCLNGSPGAVALLALNLDRHRKHAVAIPMPGLLYAITAPGLESKVVEVNGEPMNLGANDEIPDMKPVRTRPGPLSLAPASVAFVAIPDAHNPECQ